MKKNLPTIALLATMLTLTALATTAPETEARGKHAAPGAQAAAESASNESNGADDSAAANSDSEAGNSESSESANQAGSSSGENSGISTDNNNNSSASAAEQEPHTLLYYAINTIASIIGITIIFAIISSSSVTMCACVWYCVKQANGGKKPSIG